MTALFYFLAAVGAAGLVLCAGEWLVLRYFADPELDLDPDSLEWTDHDDET